MDPCLGGKCIAVAVQISPEEQEEIDASSVSQSPSLLYTLGQHGLVGYQRVRQCWVLAMPSCRRLNYGIFQGLL